jgi:hypothetical protein
MIIVRYADDIIVGFEHEADAQRFWARTQTPVRATARLRLLRGRARTTISGQAAHPRRGPAHRGERCETAGVAAQNDALAVID